jgi:hypothetical protein
LTQQAVVLQKKMNDIYTNGKLTSGLPPIHIQPPSMGSVLDMLNAINGIIFVQIRWVEKKSSWNHSTNCFPHSPKDIANLKNEIEKRQKEESPEAIEGEVKEGASELPKDEAILPAPAAVQSWISAFLPYKNTENQHTNTQNGIKNY